MNTIKSKIGIGTVQFGTNYGISNINGKTSIEEVHKILDFSKKFGIQYIDTAFAYGDAENVIGKYNNINKFRIISKYISNTENNLEFQFYESLKRLNILNYYGYIAHRPIDLINDDNKNWKILNELKNKQLVYKIGASFNTLDELKMLLDKGIELDLIQVPYNYFDRRFESEMIYLKSIGTEIHTRSAFLQGLFFCNPLKLNNFFDPIKPLLKELQQIENLSQCLLKFVLQKDFVDVVNIGVNNIDQLKNNLNINDFDATLPDLNQHIDSDILIPSKWPIQ